MHPSFIHKQKTEDMTQKFSKQFVDLAKRYAEHGQKNNFITGFTTIQIEESNVEVKVYFSDYTKKDFAVYFSIKDNYQKKVEVHHFSQTINFNFLMNTSDFSHLIDEATTKICDLESVQIVLDEESEKIKSKISDLQSQIHELSQKLIS
jgi:hypothetical protein